MDKESNVKVMLLLIRRLYQANSQELSQINLESFGNKHGRVTILELLVLQTKHVG